MLRISNFPFPSWTRAGNARHQVANGPNACLTSDNMAGASRQRGLDSGAYRGREAGTEMTKVQHRRLIRDNAPDKMREAGVAFETRQLDEPEFNGELLKKVVEEAGELGASETKADILGEPADLLAVLDQVQKTFAITDAELRDARVANAKEKGGFKERFFLEWSEGGNYNRSN